MTSSLEIKSMGVDRSFVLNFCFGGKGLGFGVSQCTALKLIDKQTPHAVFDMLHLVIPQSEQQTLT